MTFLSDFGVKDAYVAQVKAVILSQVPDVRIIDISHQIQPFNVVSAGWLVASSYRYFPSGTIHLAVVDPGVGTDRAVLFLRKDGHLFLGPDNGLFSFLFPSEEVLEITWRPEGAISSTFHGRDIFAPLAVKLLTGHGLGVPGLPKPDPVCMDVSSPMVVHIDIFGNVITNVGCDRLIQGISLVVNGATVSAVSGTFADIPDGALGLVCGSAGTIEIAARKANAAEMTGALAGMPISVAQNT